MNDQHGYHILPGYGQPSGIDMSMEDAARLIQRQTDIIMQLRTQVSLLEVAIKDWERGVPMTMTGDQYVCPFDCDNCHDDDCPCDRLGCAGYRYE